MKPLHPKLELWYRALSSPFGIEVQCNNLNGGRALLYRLRTEAKDLALEQLSLCQSPFDPNNIFIVKRKDDAQT